MGKAPNSAPCVMGETQPIACEKPQSNGKTTSAIGKLQSGRGGACSTPTYTQWYEQKDRPLPKLGPVNRVSISGPAVLRVRVIPSHWAPLSDASLASLLT